MPSSLIQHQQRMPTWRHSLTDCFEVKRHRLGICKRQHQTDCRIALRAHGAKDISGLRLLLPHDTRPRSFACPETGLGAALPDAHLVLEPDIDLLELHAQRKCRF
jgi:hypothetical protein